MTDETKLILHDGLGSREITNFSLKLLGIKKKRNTILTTQYMKDSSDQYNFGSLGLNHLSYRIDA